MSITKIVCFNVKIFHNETMDLDDTALNAINTFLADANCVYLNHSTSILSKNIEQYGKIMSVDLFLVVSLVYKDLKGTPLDLAKSSKKIKNVVNMQIEDDIVVSQSKIKTKFEETLVKANLKIT